MFLCSDVKFAFKLEVFYRSDVYTKKKITCQDKVVKIRLEAI